MRVKGAVVLFCMVAVAMIQPAEAREEIRAVGSSTVFPFVAAAAEAFGKNTEFRTPIVEPTGTGGGLKLFCEGMGEHTPDIANASRPIKPSELEQCKKNGVTDIQEIMLGFDGIILGNASAQPRTDFTREQIFLALARKVPVNGALVDNPYVKWSDIAPGLPNTEIMVYGPPPTSGTRDAFVEIVMEKACDHFHEFEAAYPDKEKRKHACGMIREDGKYLEAGENDNVVLQKLGTTPSAYGIFGYSYLEQNSDIVQGSTVEGVEPSFENIASGKYSVSRALYVYVKLGHIGKVPGIEEFIEALTNEASIGMDGTLITKGLIPLPEATWKEVRENTLAKKKLEF